MESRYATEEASASSGTQRLVAFHNRGSQQCGSSIQFRTYLRKKGIPLSLLAIDSTFFFYDAARVYYLQDHMVKFIESVHGGQANRLLQAVLADLKIIYIWLYSLGNH